MAKIFKTVMISDDIVHVGKTSTSAPLDTLNILPEREVLELNNLLDTHDALLSELKEKSQAEGYTAGFNQGLAEGLTQAQTETSEHLSALTALLQGIPMAITEQRHVLTAEIANIVLLITQRYFINQQHSKETIGQHVTQAINQLNDKQNIAIVMHPQDLALLQQSDELLNELTQCKNLRLVPDDNLRLGGCLIKSEHGVFDGSIERQIDNLKNVLLQIKQGEARE